MEFTKPRATLAETLEFANQVREAGGGSPLDALMPSVPGDASRCLIARNLNFNSMVDATGPGYTWVMYFEDKATRDVVAEKLGLESYQTTEDDDECFYELYNYGVVLPEEIGQVANDFDEAADEINNDPRDLCEEEQALVREFEPYIVESRKQAYDAALWVNPEDGSIL